MGLSLSYDAGRVLGRPEAALRWFEEEYEPAVALFREAGLLSDGGADGEDDAAAYLRYGLLRYVRLQQGGWDADIVARLKGRRPRRRK